MIDVQIVVRNYNPATDNSYIYSTWIKYSWYSPLIPHQVPKKEYFRKQSEYIKSVLDKAIIKIACLKDDPLIIMGYIIILDRKVEWLCVKKIFNNTGIRELLIKSVEEYLEWI